MDQPIRVLLAKVGLDGHDRGVKVVARSLRDAGMDVIYSGLHRTPDEVVTAAVQEDVDILGVSLLSGVQLTVFPKIFKLLEDRGASDMIVLAGGVMPDEDVVELKKMGVSEVMLQDTPPQHIIDTIRRLVFRARGALRMGFPQASARRGPPMKRRYVPTEELVPRVAAGEMAAVARMISRAEASMEEARVGLADLYRRAGSAHVIGITGVPGSGKSTAVSLLAKMLRDDGRKVAIIAVDPSSPYSGGAILGDRIRMSDLVNDPGIYIRSMATHGAMGRHGPAPRSMPSTSSTSRDSAR